MKQCKTHKRAHLKTYMHTHTNMHVHTSKHNTKTNLAIDACSLRQVITYSIEHQMSSGVIQQYGAASFYFVITLS